jgi:hypothetical protein
LSLHVYSSFFPTGATSLSFNTDKRERENIKNIVIDQIKLDISIVLVVVIVGVNEVYVKSREVQIVVLHSTRKRWIDKIIIIVRIDGQIYSHLLESINLKSNQTELYL